MEPVVVTVFALAGLLALISLLPALAEWLRLPYTVLLAAVGAALGFSVELQAMGFGIVTDFFSALRGVELGAEVFLVVFLPVLLFEAALCLDTRALLHDLAPVLLLAVGAVLLTTGVAGAALWGIDSGLPLAACLLLGAIVATTDPVAVIAMFREVGAPRRLTSLVEGESLLNDAAAIALFGVFLPLVTGLRDPEPLSGLFDFLWSFAGGAAFGLLAGRLVGLALPLLREHAVAEATLSVALAYLTFVVAGRYLAVSGVVAVVVAALSFGAHGRSRVAPAAWQALVLTWQQLAFWASSLIFVLASMLVPRTLEALALADLGLLLVLVAAALLARAIVLYGLLPLLTLVRLAERVGPAYKAVMLWGGLRGAVTLALALAVTENPFVPDDVQQFVGVLATGFVLFTLFVQATTLRPLLRRLGLHRLSPADRELRGRALELALSPIPQWLGDAAEAYGIPAERAAEVETSYRRRLGELEAEIRDVAASNVDRLRIGLRVLADREGELSRGLLDQRMIPRHLAATLIRHADELREGVKTEGATGYDRVAEHHNEFGRGVRFALLLHDRLGIERPLARRLAERFDVLLARSFLLTELRSFAWNTLGPLLGGAHSQALDEALERRVQATEQALDALRLQYPDYARALEVRYLTRAALRREDQAYRRLLDERAIGPEVFRSLMVGLRQRRRDVERAPPLDLGLAVPDLVRRVPLFADLDANSIDTIVAMLTPRLAVPGELLIKRGTRGDRMYFIASGAVEVQVAPEPLRLGSGDFVGEMALITGRPRNADVSVIGYSRLLLLEGRDFRRFLRAHPELRATILTTARDRESLRQPRQTAAGDD